MPKRNYHTKIKHKVFRRDNYTCQLNLHPECKGNMKANYDKYKAKQLTRIKVGITVDHLIPLSRGGKWEAENLVTACDCCNLLKGNRTLAEIATDLLE